MPLLGAPPLSEAQATIAAFGRWWAAELRGVIPASLRLPSMHESKRAEIRPGRTRLEIIRFSHEEAVRFVEDTPLSGFGTDNWDELDALLDGYRTSVVLTPPLTHVLTLRLPRAARGHLRSAIPLQLRDHSPLLPELLEWAIVDQKEEGDRIAIRVVIVRITTLNGIADGFLDRNLPSPPIFIEVDDGRLVRLRNARRAPGTPLPHRPWWIAAALLASTPLWMLAALHIAVLDQQSKVAAAEALAQPRLAAEKRLRDRAALGNGLKQLLAHPSVTGTIEGLAATLPVGTYVTEITEPDHGPLLITLRTSEPDAAARGLAKDSALGHLIRGAPLIAADGSTQLGFTAVAR